MNEQMKITVNGITINDKQDREKPQIHLVPPSAIKGMANVLKYGNDKYENDDGWKYIEPIRYLDAAFRHMLHMVESGLDVLDEESGLPAVDHALCSLAFVKHIITNQGDK